MSGELLTRWTIRLALLCMAARWGGDLVSRQPSWQRWSRAIWAIGCLLFTLHVAAAFHFHHHWSHAEAFETTALETERMMGTRFGAGIYFSYLFLLLWVADVAWMWLSPQQHRERSAWISVAFGLYMAFIAFNGAVVFEGGPTRLIGIPISGLLLILAAVSLKQRQAQPFEDGSNVMAKEQT